MYDILKKLLSTPRSNWGLIILFILLAEISQAQNLFVSSSGKSEGNGTISDPFGILEKGLDKITPGDTLFLLGGQYAIDQGLKIQIKGQPNAWITISNYQNQEVVLNGENYLYDEKGAQLSSDHHAVVLVQGARYLRLNGLKVINSRSQGIIVRGAETSFIDISRCKVDNTYGSGIALWYSDQSKVYESEITRANRQEMATPGRKLGSEAPHEALTVAGATNFEIHHNKVHHCDKEGIDIKEVSKNGKVYRNVVHDVKRQAYYVDAWFGHLSNIELYENIAYNNEWGFVISVEGENSIVDGVKFHNNLIYDNRGSGIYFGIWGTNLMRQNIEISNNTIVRNGSKDHWSAPTGGIDLRSPNFENVLVKDNISIDNYGFDLALPFEHSVENLQKTNLTLESNWVGKTTLVNETSDYGPLFPVESTLVSTAIFKDFNQNDFRVVQENLPAMLRQKPMAGYAFD